MTLENQDNNGLINFSDDNAIQQHIRKYRKSAEDSMTLIDEHKTKQALRNYHNIRRELQQEAQTLSVVRLADLSPLGREYIKEVPPLAASLPESITYNELYDIFNKIYKTFHALSKIR